MKKRTLALLCAVTMVIGIAVGGSLAWLVSKPDSVTNTFTTSDVDITLTEPAGENAEVKYHFQMVPGKTITKDPKVTVTAGSLDSYIFVEIEKSANYDTFLEPYAVAAGWQKVSGVEGDVYYREYASSDEAVEYQILANNQVKVSADVTKDKMDSLISQDQYPTLTFTAYAIQKDYLTGEDGAPLTNITDIWELAQRETTT